MTCSCVSRSFWKSTLASSCNTGTFFNFSKCNLEFKRKVLHLFILFFFFQGKPEKKSWICEKDKWAKILQMIMRVFADSGSNFAKYKNKVVSLFSALVVCVKTEAFKVRWYETTQTSFHQDSLSASLNKPLLMLFVQLVQIVQFHTKLLRPSPILQTLHTDLRLNRRNSFYYYYYHYFHRRKVNDKWKKMPSKEERIS